MKEIIRPGNTGIKIKYNNTCVYCGCQYTYEQEDVIPGILDGICHVYCPCCGRQNIAATLPPLNDGYSVFFDYDKKWRGDTQENE